MMAYRLPQGTLLFLPGLTASSHSCMHGKIGACVLIVIVLGQHLLSVFLETLL